MPPTPSSATAPADERRQRLAGIGWLLGATVCFTCIDTSAKWLNRSVHPLQTVTLRYLGACLLVVLFLNPRTRSGLLRTRRPSLQVARGFGLVAASICLITALRYLPLTTNTAIVFAAPLLVAALAGPLLGETLGPRRIAALLVGFVGILVVTQPWSAGFHPAMLLSLLCAVFTALYSIVTRLLAPHDSAETTLFYTSTVGAVVVLPLLPFFWQTPATPADWLAVAGMSVFGALGHWLLILAHRCAPASVVAPFFYAQLPWAVLLAFLVFHEVPAPSTLSGGAIVIASGLYLLNRERLRRHPPSADLPV